MKIKILYFLLIVALNLNGQIFKVSSGTSLFISANTTFSADNLTLVPSSSFTLSDVTLTKNNSITNGGTGTAITRAYKFSATTGAFSGTIQVNYADNELSGITESSLQVNYHNGTEWWPITSTTNDATNNYVVSNSVSNKTLNEVSLAGSAAALPVELKRFDAKVFENTVLLNWTTATEVNNSGFEVERAQIINRRAANNLDSRQPQNISWQKIARVAGQGTSNVEKNYTYRDINLRSGKYTYRLKQIDLNGSTEYSKQISLTVGDVTRTRLSINPNPFNPITEIVYFLPENSDVEIKLFDLAGREVAVLENLKESQGGEWRIAFNSSDYGLTSGVYLLMLKTNFERITEKLVLLK